MRCFGERRTIKRSRNFHAPPTLSAKQPEITNVGPKLMITCCIRYTLDPEALESFEAYAKAWPPIIARCGGKLIGYFLPKEGANNFALALIEFENLAAYEAYRAKLAGDNEAKANVAHAKSTRCILIEERSFLRRP